VLLVNNLGIFVRKEALASLKEAIKTAHEANDNLCLQHALSWLYRLSNVNKDNLIVQCIIKTFELNMNYTTSLALQNFAHYGSAKTSVKPSVIFEVCLVFYAKFICAVFA